MVLDGVREAGRNIKLDVFFAVFVIVAVVRTSHDVSMLEGFLGFQRAEDRLIKKYKYI